MALSFRDRGSAKRVAVVDAYQFPSGVRQRFGFAFPALSADDIATVEAALRQWLRLHARHRAELTMPSVVAELMWHELARHTAEYEELCAEAIGRVPQSAATGTGLREAYLLACVDEPVEKPRLPLLFRVDRELTIAGGHHYLADCGGRGQCFGAPGGARCLEHIAGPGKPRRRWRTPGGDLYPGGTRITETPSGGST